MLTLQIRKLREAKKCPSSPQALIYYDSSTRTSVEGTVAFVGLRGEMAMAIHTAWFMRSPGVP